MFRLFFPYLSTILIFFSFFPNARAQKKRVVVVRYTRFQFVSEFTLEEIAENNTTNASNVFDLYQKSLNEVFATYKNEQVEFINIPASSYQEYKRFIKYGIDKFDGKKFN